MERKDTLEFQKEIAATRTVGASVGTLMDGLTTRITQAAEKGDMPTVLKIAGEMRAMRNQYVESVLANTKLAPTPKDVDPARENEKNSAAPFEDRSGTYGSQGPKEPKTDEDEAYGERSDTAAGAPIADGATVYGGEHPEHVPMSEDAPSAA